MFFKMWYVYVLRSKVSPRFYTGMSSNVENRLKEHNRGKTKSTNGYRPWELVFKEDYQTREEARKRELYLKSGIGREYIKKIWSRSSAG